MDGRKPVDSSQRARAIELRMIDLEAQRISLREKLTSGALSDALDTLGVWSVLHPRIRHHGGKQRSFFGRAYTVCWGPTRKQRDIRGPMPSTWVHVRDFLVPDAQGLAGMVYVAGSQSGMIDRFALAGGLSTAHFQRLGMEAIVLGGAVRDAEELAQREIPIWATSLSPADSQGNYRVVSTGTECIVDDILVRTGDWVFGDSTGIIVVPVAHAQEAVGRALEILDAEASIDGSLNSSESLFSVLEKTGHI
ncbi:MAG: dimethylmenaquinone methyltransferase [Myxococcaceae bacterium]|nr:dimethylmenaquinone methyltransferase [Myxococcaceae bacterium]